jgi:ABC-type branched-subunit amino acid transport system ATPase component
MPTSPDSNGSRPDPVFVLENVSTGYGSSLVVLGVSASVASGQVVTIVGPNGSGKSTLLKAITGGLPVRSGRVWLDGKDVTNLRRDLLVRRGIGYLPQENEVFKSLSVRENLELGGYMLARSRVPDAVDRVLATFPALAPMLKVHAGKLSGGERKMLAMGRILMSSPRVVILDEPTASLSPAASKAVLAEQVPTLAKAGAAIILVEQRAAQALAIADWAYVLVSGAVFVDGPAQDISSRGDIGELFLGQTVSESSDGTG